jgi:hypothetical protein
MLFRRELAYHLERHFRAGQLLLVCTTVRHCQLRVAIDQGALHARDLAGNFVQHAAVLRISVLRHLVLLVQGRALRSHGGLGNQARCACVLDRLASNSIEPATDGLPGSRRRSSVQTRAPKPLMPRLQRVAPDRLKPRSTPLSY